MKRLSEVENDIFQENNELINQIRIHIKFLKKINKSKKSLSDLNQYLNQIEYDINEIIDNNFNHL